MANREIKFRVWNTKSKKMMSGQDVMNFTLAQLDGIVGAEIMQFIGLKDKNGKEIYEGDILRRYSEGDMIDFQRCEVGWHKGRCMFDLEGTKYAEVK